MQKTQVRSLGQEDPLEKGMATQLQYSCLGNPMDRGAWWATVPGIVKSLTWLSEWAHTLQPDWPSCSADGLGLYSPCKAAGRKTQSACAGLPVCFPGDAGWARRRDPLGMRGGWGAASLASPPGFSSKLPRTAVAPFAYLDPFCRRSWKQSKPREQLVNSRLPPFSSLSQLIFPSHHPISPNASASCSLKSPPLLPVQARLSPALPDVAYPYNGILSPRLHAADTEVRTP